MAVAVVASSVVINSGTGATTYTGSTYTISTGNCVVLAVTATQNSGTLANYANTTATYGGVSMVPVRNSQRGGVTNEAGALLFMLVNPPSGAQTPEVTFDGSGLRACGATIIELSGVDTTTPVGHLFHSSSSLTAHSLSAEGNDSLIISLCTARDGDSGPFTPAADVTELQDYSTGTANFASHAGMVGYKASTTRFASYALGGAPTVGGTDQAAVAAEFRASGEAVPQIRFVGWAGVSRAGATSGATTLPLTGLVGGIGLAPEEDDVVYAYNGASGGAVPTVLSSGYTDLANRVNRKVMGASPDTDFQTNPSGNSQYAQALAAMVFRGVDTTTPEDATKIQSTTDNPGAITPVTADALVFVMGIGVNTGGSGVGDTLTAADLSPFWSQDSTDTRSCSVGAGVKAVDWVSGAVDPGQWIDVGGQYGSWAISTMALRPASGGGVESGAGSAAGVATAAATGAATGAGAGAATGAATGGGAGAARAAVSGTAAGAATAGGVGAAVAAGAGAASGTAVAGAAGAATAAAAGAAAGVATVEGIGESAGSGIVSGAGAVAGTSVAAGTGAAIAAAAGQGQGVASPAGQGAAIGSADGAAAGTGTATGAAAAVAAGVGSAAGVATVAGVGTGLGDLVEIVFSTLEWSAAPAALAWDREASHLAWD